MDTYPDTSATDAGTGGAAPGAMDTNDPAIGGAPGADVTAPTASPGPDMGGTETPGTGPM